MRLLSVCGDTLFKSSYITLKESLEEAIAEGICLDYINLRKANLKDAQLDTAKMHGACFWGADLTNANMSDGQFTGSDFRAAKLKDTCLCDSDFSESRFNGAYFSKPLISGTDLSNTEFSCPSILLCDFHDVKSLQKAIYIHQGEKTYSLSKVPIIIQGLEKLIVILDDVLLVGHEPLKQTPIIQLQKPIISDLCQRIIQS